MIRTVTILLALVFALGTASFSAGQEDKRQDKKRRGDKQAQLDNDRQKEGRAKRGQRGRARIAQMLKRLDKNEDGNLAEEELPERLKRAFGQFDQNDDGLLDEKEQRAMGRRLAQMGARDSEKGDDGKRRRGNRDSDDRQEAPNRLVKILKQLDKDGDGKIAKTEAPDRLQQRFGMIDTNGDESLDEKEIQEFAKRMQRRAREGKGDGKMRKGRDKKSQGGGEAVKPKRPPTGGGGG